MKRFVTSVCFLAGVWPVTLCAQQGPNREALTRQVMERFVQNYTTQAGLTGDQADRFRDLLGRSLRERTEIENRQRQLFRALEMQLRPGVAADQDSVVVLLDGIATTRQNLVDSANRYDQEFSALLNPVQRAQLVLSFQRFQQQIATLLQRRAQQDRPRRQ